MSFHNVVVLGGGPIGLMCAIEARQKFVSDVTIIEKRTQYTRTNVPQLQTPILKHLEKVGVAHSLGVSSSSDKMVSFSRMEEALWEKAKALGVKMERGYVVHSVIGTSLNKYGRYKSLALFLSKWNEKSKSKDTTAAPKRISADLLVVATGGGASVDPVILNTLGFSYEKLDAVNYGAYGIFDNSTSKDERQFDWNLRKQLMPFTSEVTGGGALTFSASDHNYLLLTLATITKKDFDALQQTTSKLRILLEAVGKTINQSVLEDIKEVDKNMAVFTIAIQRARQFYSPEYPAVLMGDAAVTPHPEAGSGITTGFKGFEELRKLFKALKKTHRSKDNSILFMSFNDRVELHVSRKALEGTGLVLKNLVKMVDTFHADLKIVLAKKTWSSQAEMIAKMMLDTAAHLKEELNSENEAVKKFQKFLGPEDGSILPQFDWDETAGCLWKHIGFTYEAVLRLTDNIGLLNKRLERIKQNLPTASTGTAQTPVLHAN